jgi:protein O-GlcNAc transferase
MDAAQKLRLAGAKLERGEVAEAERLCREVLAGEPNSVHGLALSGTAALAGGRAEAAINLFGRAVSLLPDHPRLYVNLGEACRRAGRALDAVAHLRRAVSLKPDLAAAHYNLALALRDAGSPVDAVAEFEEAMRLQPGIDALGHYGSALKASGQLDRAIAYYRGVLERSPRLAGVHHELGDALHSQRSVDEAIVYYEQALRLGLDDVRAHLRLAFALRDRGRLDEAIGRFERVLDLDPSRYDVLRELASTLTSLGRLDDAIAVCRRAIELRPDSPGAGSDLLFLLHYHPDWDARAIFAQAVAWRVRHAEPLAAQIAPQEAPSRATGTDGRLRIGYVSADFAHHVSSCFTLPLLAHHDHDRLEIFCYADVKKPDRVTESIRACADHWRDIVRLSEAEVAEAVRHDRIDILVDLSMHIAESRPLIFARKPAPVQMCWLAYPGTTGLTTIDYRLSDPYLDPEGSDTSVYVERTLRLPDCFWCYDPRLPDLEVAPLPSATAGFPTFGSLNTFAKVNAGVIDLWARVLREVEGSRLLLYAPPGRSREWVSGRFGRQGIDERRVEFVYAVPRRDYFSLYDRIDLCLDTFPYNGHTTSLDAYFMGVPVVTLVGATACGRAGASFAMNLGLPELVSRTPDEYVAAAASLARSPARLAALRSGLRPRMQSSPLMNAPKFARDFEAIYRRVWEEYCRQTRR